MTPKYPFAQLMMLMVNQLVLLKSVAGKIITKYHYHARKDPMMSVKNRVQGLLTAPVNLMSMTTCPEMIQGKNSYLQVRMSFFIEPQHELKDYRGQ